MKWFIENWSLLVTIAIVIFLGIVYINRFMRIPSAGKIELIKQWALYIVIEMERLYGNGTGSLKLAAAYDAFIKTFYPQILTLRTMWREVSKWLQLYKELHSLT